MIHSSSPKLASPATSRKPAEGELAAAVYEGDLAAVKALLARGADPNDTQLGKSALIIAAANGKGSASDMMRLLIDSGADLEFQRYFISSTALGGAARNGRIESVRLLINAGADLDKADCIGQTALDKAKLYGHKEIVKMLKDAPKLRKQQAQEKARRAAANSLLADTLSSAVAVGNCQKVRDIFDQAFWEKWTLPVTWDHLKIALKRDDRPMMRLLITWGATAPDEKRALLTAKETSLLRQCGLRILSSGPVQAEPETPPVEKKETINPLELIPQEWLTVLNALQARGAKEAVIAGGALRDTFNGRAVKDVDIFLQSRGDTKKNKNLLQAAFKAAKLQIVKQFETDEYGMAQRLEAFPDPRAGKLYKTFHDSGYGSFTAGEPAESWKVLAGWKKTEYNIVFTGGPTKKVPGIIYPLLEEVPDPSPDFAESLVNNFDFGICQIAYNGEKFITTPAYQEDVKDKQMTLVQPNPGTPEHQARLVQKYPEWAIRKKNPEQKEKRSEKHYPRPFIPAGRD